MIKHLFKYASLAELVQKAIHAPAVAKDRASRRTGDDHWHGASWGKAETTAVSGDMEGARRLAPSILNAVNALVANQPRLDPVYRLDEGRWIDVARYVKGEPECWGDMVETGTAPRKGAAVIVNVAAQAGIDSKALDKVGVCLGSAILGLQAQGYAVTLYAAQKVESYNEDALVISAPINPGGAPLDVAHLSTVLRPWFLRRIIFSLEETFSREIITEYGFDGGGYGRPRDITAGDVKAITGLDKALIVNMQNAARNPEQVRDILLRQIKGA